VNGNILVSHRRKKKLVKFPGGDRILTVISLLWGKDLKKLGGLRKKAQDPRGCRFPKKNDSG